MSDQTLRIQADRSMYEDVGNSGPVENRTGNRTSKPADESKRGTPSAQVEGPESRLQKPTVLFQIDKATNLPVIRVLDSETGKLIRQVPPTEATQLADVMEQFSESKIDRFA